MARLMYIRASCRIYECCFDQNSSDEKEELVQTLKAQMEVEVQEIRFKRSPLLMR